MRATKKSNPHNLKEKQVKELAEKIKKARTLMIVSVKALPSKQFQEIKKGLREHAYIKVAKKNILLRTIKAIGKESILALENHIKDNCAIAISDVEGYELAGILLSKKTPVYAKAGQIAPVDIEVKEGPTSLVPGPAISELGALGIQISVEGGKIAIKKAKVVAKTGDVISANAAAMFQKLNIQPFSIGLEPICVYDIKTEKIYSDINIDSEGTAKELASAAGKALGFAQKISYYCQETITYFLAKANMQENAIHNKLSQGGTA
jgi:large subunit ribosomal protein L10